MVWLVDLSNKTWIDLLDKDNTQFTGKCPSVDVSDRFPGLVVRYPDADDREQLKGVYTDAKKMWECMAFTVGVPSDQSVYAYRKRKSGAVEISDADVRNVLTVRDSELTFLATLAGTIIGVKDGAPVAVNSDTVIRNGFLAAQRYCDQLAAWAFRPQVTATVTHRLDMNVEWLAPEFRVGTCVSYVEEGKVRTDVQAPIQRVSISYEAGEITAATEIPPQPGRNRGGSGSSPAGGGPISVELGGTVAQVAQRNGEMLQQIKADLAARPLIPAVAGGAAAAQLRLLIIGGNTSNGVNCIKFASSVTPAKVYDPDVDTTYPDGLGRAVLFVDGVDSGRVLVRHLFESWKAPLIGGQVMRVTGTAKIGSGEDDTENTVYLVGF
jgi:hypothetical protein